MGVIIVMVMIRLEKKFFKTMRQMHCSRTLLAMSESNSPDLFVLIFSQNRREISGIFSK